MARYAVLILLSELLLTACSPYVYKQEITAFSTGVGSLVTSYQTGRQSLDTQVLQEREAGYAAKHARLHLLVGCLQSDPTGTPAGLAACAIVPVDATVTPSPPSSEVTLADAAPTFVALKTYADALTAVTNAADETALAQATGSLASAVARLAPTATGTGPVMAEASGVIDAAIVGYLDKRRYAVLRDRVPAANTSIQALSPTAQATLAAIRQAQLEHLKDDMLSAQVPFLKSSVSQLSQAEYRSQLAVLEARVTAFNQARAGNPAAAVAAMVNAHQQLADALSNGSGQSASVLAAARSFVTAAGKLQAATGAAAAGAAISGLPAGPKI